MSTFAEYPLKETHYVTATELAREESLDHPDHNIYLLKLSSGGYVIDYMGIVGHDERVVMIFKGGKRET